MAGFQVYSFASGMINTIMSAATGDLSGLGAGIGGMVGGAFGWQAATAGAALFTKQALGTFGAGFITGAIEFGAAGFGAGFGAALGSGASFGDAVTAGLITGGVGAVAGGIIQGSYHAGWQNVLHGTSMENIAKNKAAKMLRFGRRLVKREHAEAFYYQRAIKDTSPKLFDTYKTEFAKKSLNVKPFTSPLKKVIRHNIAVRTWLQPDAKTMLSDFLYIPKLEAFDTATRYIYEDSYNIYGKPMSFVRDAIGIAW